MRAQQTPVREIKRIVHRPRRMILRNIQRLEIVEVVLDLGTRRYLESGLRENALDPQPRAGDRMQAARLLAAARQGHIDFPLGEFRGHRRLLEADAVHLERRLDRGLGLVDPLPRRRPLRPSLKGSRPRLSPRAPARPSLRESQPRLKPRGWPWLSLRSP